jgi:hypothetical protein
MFLKLPMPLALPSCFLQRIDGGLIGQRLAHIEHEARMRAVEVIAAAEQRGVFREQPALQSREPFGQAIDFLRHVGLLELEHRAGRIGMLFPRAQLVHQNTPGSIPARVWIAGLCARPAIARQVGHASR